MWFSSLQSGLGLETPKIDDSLTAYNERFYCASCHRTGPLTIHGRCGTCNSLAVQSTRLLPVAIPGEVRRG